MLLFLTTFLLIIAGVSLAVFLKKLSNQNLLEENDPPVRLDAETYRPLFAPTDEDLRLAAAEEKRQLKAKQDADERQQSEEKLAELEELRQSWSRSPTRAATVDLLHRASQASNGDAYMNTFETVLDARREGRLTDIPPDDLAQLLEAHFWLLPADQRTPGASFRLKQAVSDLRNVEENEM